MANNPFNPFASMDFSKFDLTKILGDVNIPGFDMDAIMAAQRKNIEALTAANQAAVQGMQAVAQRQAEIMSKAMSEVSSIAQQLASSVSNPQEITTKQAELVRKAFEQALANARELAEIVSESNTEAFTIINRRVTMSLKELKELIVVGPDHSDELADLPGDPTTKPYGDPTTKP